MFGTKLRSWMETHIVRSRKKQQRNKDDKNKPGGSSTKLVGSSPLSHVKSDSFEKQYDKNFARSSKNVEDSEMEITTTVTNLGDCKITKASMNLEQPENNPLNCTITNLSSPESAYSTGYSTDGTSPGASVPPEYYINLRTGTHYFHSNEVSNSLNSENRSGNQNKDTSSSGFLIPLITNKVGSINRTPGGPFSVLSPKQFRHKKEDVNKSKQTDGLRESSTEEDLIAEKVTKNNIFGLQHSQTPKVQNKIIQPMHNFHRRTESYDETHQQRSSLMSPSHQDRDSGDSSSALTTISYQCTSPYLPGASPRQRNRIRTNPWVTTQPVNGNNLPIPLGIKNYNSQGETSSTVGSSSTLSSNGCKQINDEHSKKSFSPRAKERKRFLKEDIKDLKNANIQQNPSILKSSPLKRGTVNSVTTCSPSPSHPCRHALRSRSPMLSSSSSSAPSSASEDEHHGNTSDFSDDDVTLNEMLGKFDESYVYEKETDILSDSDPTDCEEQADHDNKFDESNSFEKESCEELDFIDNGSLVELAHSDSECSSKAQNTGHCTYHLPGNTPEMTFKITPRLQGSLMTHHHGETSNRSSRSRRNSRKKITDTGVTVNQSCLISSHRKISDSRKKLHNAKKRSVENLPQNENRKMLEVNGKLVKPCEAKPLENSGKYLNLNRVLMERLINNQRNGTRSADGTPVSLRRHISQSDYNGKYIRNHHVSKLINSNMTEKRNSFEERKEGGVFETKKRSNSLTGHYNGGVFTPQTSPSTVRVGLRDVDKDGDIKYRRLIQEAENFIEDFQIKSRNDYSTPLFHGKSGVEYNVPQTTLSVSVPQSPLSLKSYKCGQLPAGNNFIGQLNHEKIENDLVFDKKYLSNKTHDTTSNGNDEGLLKTISKTLEKIVRNTSDTNRKLDKSVEDPFAKGRNKMFIPSSPALFSNKNLLKDIDNKHIAMLPSGRSTPINVRRSSVENGLKLLSTFSTPETERKSHEINNESQYSRFCVNSDINGKLPFDNSIERNALTVNGFNNNAGNKYSSFVNCIPGRESQTIKLKTGVSGNIESVLDFSPNANIPPFLPGIQNIPWQHRSSKAERFKHFVNSSKLSKRHCNSTEPISKQKPSLLTFRSFDLGNENVTGTRYCPQSEPVKRKVYTCSASFGKLQKSLLRKHTSRSNESAKLNDIGNRNTLKDKVAQLKKERIQVEAKVWEVQEHIDRIKLTGENTGTG